MYSNCFLKNTLFLIIIVFKFVNINAAGPTAGVYEYNMYIYFCY